MSAPGGQADVIRAKADIQTTPDSHACYSGSASLWLGGLRPRYAWRDQPRRGGIFARKEVDRDADDACKTSPRHLPIRYKSVRSGAVTLRAPRSICSKTSRKT